MKQRSDVGAEIDTGKILQKEVDGRIKYKETETKHKYTALAITT